MAEITFDIIQDSFPELQNSFKEYESHCVTYLINNQKQIYIGESSHLKNRFKDHSKTKEQYKFKKSHIITSEFFNKSAVYDVETKLIEYIFADKRFEVVNKKTNQSSHEYYMKKEINDVLFRTLWAKLQEKGIAHPHLKNPTDPFSSFSNTVGQSFIIKTQKIIYKQQG